MRGFATTPHPKAAAATVGEISAARISHTENAWLFTRTTEPRRLVGGTACEVIGSREYEAYEIVKLVEWLADRKAGYPSLKQFEGGANWPNAHEQQFARGTRQSSPERAAHIERANNAAYHGDIDGDSGY